MSKALEALNGLFDLIHCQDSFEKAQKYFDIIEEALQRLESIDNAEPSEALECLEKVYSRLPQWDLSRNVDQCNIIKQALLKQQEPKQYLKWEDLEFNQKPVFTRVRMGEAIYGLVIGFDYTKKETIFLRTDSQQIVFHEKDKQFFNNLHLERMEE